MEIYEALIKDHDKVKGLLSKLIKSEGGNFRDLVSQIRDELIPHSRAEEAVFYNSIREVKPAKDVVMHGYAEHVAAEGLLRTLQAVKVFDTAAMTVAKKLKETYENHIASEENEIFKAAKELFSHDEAEQMCKAFEKMKPEIKNESIFGTTWEMIVNLMPARLRENFRDKSVHQLKHAN